MSFSIISEFYSDILNQLKFYFLDSKYVKIEFFLINNSSASFYNIK
jgi:hypothetical protein